MQQTIKNDLCMFRVIMFPNVHDVTLNNQTQTTPSPALFVCSNPAKCCITIKKQALKSLQFYFQTGLKSNIFVFVPFFFG